jgi:mannitol/fructose-specific phosphotransferase system IIA component (Ntr-type)
MAAAVGISSNGIEFNSLDKQPVYTVFLLLSPQSRPEEHLQAMELIFKNLSKDTFRRELRQADSAEKIHSLLDDADHHRVGG